MPDTPYRRLDDRTWVSGQIDPADVPALAAAGVTMIVNNRPDGEEPGQPAATDIEAAVRSAGLSYRHVPIGGLSPDKIKEMAEALEAAGGPVLAFCKSGTRSTFLWALARSQHGEDGQELFAKAAAAGYDLSPIAGFLRRV